MTARRLAIVGLALGPLLIAIAYGTAWAPAGAPRWGIWSMIVGAALTMSATLALGALRSGVRAGVITATACFLFVVVVAGFGAPLLLPQETATGILLLGLPLRAAIEIYGVGLLPILVLPFVFAREFKADDLDEASLDRLRVECARLRAESDRAREGRP